MRMMVDVLMSRRRLELDYVKVHRCLDQAVCATGDLRTRKAGADITPLNTNVPYAMITKPKPCTLPDNGRKTSQPRHRLTAQIPSVRNVSIVLRAVALKSFVTFRPRAL